MPYQRKVALFVHTATIDIRTNGDPKCWSSCMWGMEFLTPCTSSERKGDLIGSRRYSFSLKKKLCFQRFDKVYPNYPSSNPWFIFLWFAFWIVMRLIEMNIHRCRCSRQRCRMCRLQLAANHGLSSDASFAIRSRDLAAASLAERGQRAIHVHEHVA